MEMEMGTMGKNNQIIHEHTVCITGHLWMESTGHRCVHPTKVQ